MTYGIKKHISDHACNRIADKNFKLRRILLKSRMLPIGLDIVAEEIFIALIYYDGEYETGFMFSFPFRAADMGDAVMQISSVYVNR